MHVIVFIELSFQPQPLFILFHWDCVPLYIIFIKLLQYKKVQYPIFVTLLGIVTLVKLLHPQKASYPILVTPSGIVILVKLLQPQKALSPILVTLFGIL